MATAISFPEAQNQTLIIMGKLNSRGLNGNVATEFFGKLNLRQTKAGIVTSRIVETNSSKSPAQMARRIRWSNMAAIYAALREAARQGFSEVLAGFSYWNSFVTVNTNRVRLAITKEERNAGMAIVGPYQVTKGDIEPIQVNGHSTNIALGDLVISATTTVAEFAKAVIENNSVFAYGDKLTFFQLQQVVLAGMPKVKFAFATVQLDPMSQDVLPAIIGQSVDGYLGNASLANFIGGFCWIHSRLGSDNQLHVSSQELICQNDQIIALYDTADRRLAVAESYGADFRNTIVLRPNSADAIALEEFGLSTSRTDSSSAVLSLCINSVECNGLMALSGADPIQIKSGQTLKIYGQGLSATNAEVHLNGTLVSTGITVKDGIMSVAVPASFATATDLTALQVKCDVANPNDPDASARTTITTAHFGAQDGVVSSRTGSTSRTGSGTTGSRTGSDSPQF